MMENKLKRLLSVILDVDEEMIDKMYQLIQLKGGTA